MNYFPQTTAQFISAFANAMTLSGDHKIYLRPNFEYIFTTVYNDNGANALPVFQGASTQITIIGQGATLRRAAGAPDFRFLEIAAGKKLVINGVSFQDGKFPLGGAIFNKGALEATNCDFLRNEAKNTAQQGYGGAIEQNDASIAKLEYCLFEKNASNTGGAIHSKNGAITAIIGCDFNENTATIDGGAIETWDANNTVEQSIFFKNEAFRCGGAIFIDRGEIEIKETTFEENNAGTNGSAIARDSLINTTPPSTLVRIQYSRFVNNFKSSSIRCVYNNTNNIGVNISAEYNWWGSSDGPSGNAFPPGNGDSISDRVDYVPYIVDEASLHGGKTNCFAYATKDSAGTSDPISLRLGEVREEATDFSLTSRSNNFNFTRYFAQSNLEDANYQFMGAGWSHNHAIRLVASTGIPNYNVKVLLGNSSILMNKYGDTFYIAPGATASMTYDNATNELIFRAQNGHAFVFDATTWVVKRQLLPTGDAWSYIFTDGKLTEINDGYSRKLRLAYINNPGQFDHGQLWRVGDQDTSGLENTVPSGRYVEYGYSNELLNALPTGRNKALLTRIQDLRYQNDLGRPYTSQIYRIDYYGLNTGENDVNRLNFLTRRYSPDVSTTGSANDMASVQQETLTYSMNNTLLTDVTQQQGVFGGYESLKTELGFQPGQSITTEKVAGKTSSHYFVRGIHAGLENPAGNSSKSTVTSDFRIVRQKDANKNRSAMTWFGNFLNQITDALGNKTNFDYYKAESFQNALRSSVDAEGGKTIYLYSSTNFRSPETIIISKNGEDLAVNGDMELNASWDPIPGFAPTVNEPAFTTVAQGFSARRVVGSAVGKGIEGVAWNVEAGKRYLISGLVYITSGSAKIKVSGIPGAEQVVTTTGNWQTVKLIVTSPTSVIGCKLQFIVNSMPVSGDAEFFVDAVSILDTSTLSRWQEYSYDAIGNLLEEKVINPKTGDILSQTSRTYYPTNAPTGAGLLQTVSQIEVGTGGANNQTITFFYDSVGRIVQQNRSANFGSCDKTRTVYNSANDTVASICNYDNPSGNHPITIDQAIALFNPQFPDKNRVTTHEYDALGRRIKTTTDAGANYATDAGANYAQTTLTVYDGLDRVVRTIVNYVPDVAIPNPYTAAQNAFAHGADNTQNLVTDTAYNQRGMVRKQVDVLGNVALFGYDGAGRLVKTIQNASAPTYNNDYAGTGSDPLLANYTPISATDKDIITQNVYDANGNLVMTTDALGRNTVQVYDALNRVVKTVRNPKAAFNITLKPGDVGYDATNDPRSSSYSPSPDPDRDQIDVTEYDAMGRVARTQDTLQNWTLYGYDTLGRQVRVIRNASNPAYDRLTDPTLSSYLVTTLADSDLVSDTVYDASGRVLYTTGNASLASPSGEKTWTAYDGLGRVVRTVANAVGNATDGGVNDPRSIENYVENSSADKDHISRTQYDSNGRVQWTQDALGRKTWYVYDSVGRQKKVIQNCTYVSGSPAPEDDTYFGQHAADTSKDVITKTIYDAQGRVSSTIDPRGNETRYQYDILGRRIKTIRNYVDGVYAAANPDEDISDTVVYDLAGRVSRTIDNANNETRFSYDAAGRRTAVILNYQDGIFDGAQPDRDLISTTVYDKARQVQSVTDARGTQTTFGYDQAGRQHTVTQAAGTPLAATSYTCFDKAGRVLRAIQNYQPAMGDPSPDARSGSTFLFNPTNHGPAEDTNLITTYTLDKAGRQTQIANSLGETTTFTYEKSGQMLQMTDPLGVVTAYRYNRAGRRVLVAQSYLPNAATLDRDLKDWIWDDAVGQKKWKDGTGAAIAFGANNDQNILAQAEFDKGGRMLALREPRGNRTTYTYDLLDRRTSLTDPRNSSWTTAFAETAGTLQTTQTNPLGYATQQKTDKLGRPVAVNYLSESPKLTPDVTWAYDSAGVRTKMTELNGASTVRSTTYTYDAARRLKSVGLDADGNGTIDQTVSYSYDAGGLRTKITLPDGKTIDYTYDTRGQLVSLTDWSTQTTRYGYDRAGRLAAALKPNVLLSQYRYDAAGRLANLRHSSGPKVLGDFRYTVDKRGNRTRVLETLPKATTGATTFAFDDAGLDLPTGSWVNASPFKTSTSFSASLRLTFAGSGDMLLRMGVGPDHGIYDIYVNGDLWQTANGYAATTGETTYTISLRDEGPHTLELRNRPDKDLRATGFTIRYKSLTTPAASRLFDVQTNTYTYDAVSRLLIANTYTGQNTAGQSSRREAFTYDLSGNRLSQQVTIGTGSPVTTSYAYDIANRMTNAGGQTLTYDNAGRMTSDGTTTQTWDRADRLLSRGTTSYSYNGLGQRLSQTVSGTVTSYLLDQQPGLVHLLAATTGANTTRYVHSPMGMTAQQNPDAAWRWTVTDGLGSVRGVVDAANAPLESRQYAPYGEPFGASGTNQTVFGYTGEPTDGNGLVHLRARYYSPNLGAFPSLDPLEGDLGNPLSLHRYAYVQGNPINRRDPSGLLPCEATAAACGAAVAFPFDGPVLDVPVCAAAIACYGVAGLAAMLTVLAGPTIAQKVRDIPITWIPNNPIPTSTPTYTPTPGFPTVTPTLPPLPATPPGPIVNITPTLAPTATPTPVRNPTIAPTAPLTPCGTPTLAPTATATKTRCDADVFRVQGGTGNDRSWEFIRIRPDGGLQVQRELMAIARESRVYVTFDNPDRALEFLIKNRPNGYIIGFKIDSSFVTAVRGAARMEDEKTNTDPGIWSQSPLIGDAKKSNLGNGIYTSFGLPEPWLTGLEQSACPGTGYTVP